MNVQCIRLFWTVQVYDSTKGDLLLTLTKSRHLIVTSNQFVEVSLSVIDNSEDFL